MTKVAVACRKVGGLGDIRQYLEDTVRKGDFTSREHAGAVNQRHKAALEQAKESLQRSLETIRSGLSAEFIAVDLRGALDSLGLIIGATYTDDILERIFNDFCIGK